ncbi:acyl carrier protein [Actinomadura sp. KC345]|uniref:acyl carrier protein n=1 Tax=Actinomadura sp. KC345 TaxID=2530371 RepID=UPI00104DEBB6|nr:acyl carrier protein [Actinomadura sp. KC345]TDC49295.1 acyl carrier protein [Actinomadura sp. KC345]
MNDDLSEVVRMLTDVVGEDFLTDVAIGPDTAFGDALVLESIEFAALAARVRDHGADLPALIAGLDLDQLLNLTVGDVADHVAGTRTATGAAR